MQMTTLAAESTRALAGRQVLVAGATGALGAACARALHAAGASLVLLGRRLKPLEKLDDELRAAGADPALYPLNVEGATAQDYGELAERLELEIGGIHGLVWCTGLLPELMPVEDHEPSDWIKVLHVNLHAPALLASALTPQLRAHAGFLAFALNDPTLYRHAYWGAYGVAQAGLNQLVHTLSEECERSGPQVLGAMLPAFKSGLRLRAFPGETPDRLATPALVAEALVSAIIGGRRGVHPLAVGKG